jgi:hypothetical protein
MAVEALNDKLNELGYDMGSICFIALQGSQNYNLDTYEELYESDFDWKVFVYPTFEDVYYGRKVSKTIEYEFGQFELKDIRLFPELLSKMNSSYLELLYTDYFFGEPLVQFRDCANQLITERVCLLIKTLMGMALEKQSALCKPYSGLVDKLEKFGGYDPKQLHHAYRIKYMLCRLNDNFGTTNFINYKNILEFSGGSFAHQHLMDVKVHGVVSKSEAERQMEDVISKCRTIYERFWEEKQPKFEIKSDALNKIEKLVYELVKERLS